MIFSPVAKHSIFFFSFIGFAVNILYAGYSFGAPSITVFLFLYAIVALTYLPRQLISPSSIIFGYYFVWFILAPTFSKLHEYDDFSSRNYYICYSMITLVFAVAMFGIKVGEAGAPSVHKAPIMQKMRRPKLSWIVALYIASTTLVLAIVLSSGGIMKWVTAPGDAFLNRAGSGVYVILSHFTTFCLAGLVGYYAYVTKRRLPLYLFLVWLVLTSPVHGSKGLISLFLILLFSPWLSSLRLLTARSVLFVIALVAVFFLGLYFRNISWLTLGEAVPYALNYFTTLRNLHILVEDFSPGFMTTFWLPFNKFLTPFGLTDTSLYFDMNHYLTDIYFPTAWEIRATEQWPVEADMYLNFYFIFGLPLIFFYTYAVSRIHSLALSKRNLGLLVVSMLLIVSLISHFRGSIINHLDFYLYPMFGVIYFLLRGYKFAPRT